MNFLQKIKTWIFLANSKYPCITETAGNNNTSQVITADWPHSPHSAAQRMSEPNRFLYLRISGVSFFSLGGATFTLMCEPRLGMLLLSVEMLEAPPGEECSLRRLACAGTPKPNAWKERAETFLRSAGCWCDDACCCCSGCSGCCCCSCCSCCLPITAWRYWTDTSGPLHEH